MRNTARQSHAVRRILGLVVVAASVTLALPESARANGITPPEVPEGLKVEEGHKVFFVGRGIGTQNYICLPSGSGFAWTLFTPQATLFSSNGRQLTTHFFSPDPETGTVRPTWQHSRDTSSVWAQLVPDGLSTDANFVAEGAIPWLLLEKKATQEGFGSDTLTQVTFIQRVNTLAGSAPSTGCAIPSDVGSKAFVPYQADYFFYKRSDQRNQDEGN